MGERRGYCSMLLAWLKRVKPYLLMVSIQFGSAGNCIIALISLKHGMSHFVLPVYRHGIATLALAPFALVLERKVRPKMTLSIFLQIMLLALIEPVLDQNVYYLGMKYTSATLASATVNLIPAITFVMAIILRLEKVNVKKMRSVAKVIGTVITITGAMVMTLYKGPILEFLKSTAGNHHGTASEVVGTHRLAGTLMIIASCCLYSSYVILLSFVLKKYPAELSLTALICLMGMLEGAAVTLVMERDMNAWKIGFDSRLLAVVYAGLVSSGFGYYVQGVVNKERGPVFVTSFYPLAMILTATLEAIVLGAPVHLGSIIGAIIIVFGFYLFVWSKSKDRQSTTTTTPKLTTEINTIDHNHDLELPVSNKAGFVADHEAVAIPVSNNDHQQQQQLEGHECVHVANVNVIDRN